MTTRRFFDDINGAVERSGPRDEPFALWIDRQQRPTVGATVRGRPERRRRWELSDAVFLKMIESISKMLDDLPKPYLTYSYGTWSRARQFHVKAHLLTETFLALTKRICREHGILENEFESEKVKSELETRQKKDYYYPKLEEMFKIEKDGLQNLAEIDDYKIVTSKEIFYPVAVLYNRKVETSMIPVDELPHALGILENFVKKKWRVPGCAFGMLSHDKGTAFQLAVIFDEDDYVHHFGRGDKADLQKNWGWKEPSRKYHKN